MAFRSAPRRDEGRPLQVVRFDDKNGIILNNRELSVLLGRDDVKNSEVAVLSIAGVSRTGKSFLMNYLLRYLKKDGMKGWIGEYDEPLEGFEWRQGVEPSTRGIYMWSKPFHVTSKDGRKVALLLMDTQGLFDYNQHPETASVIFALSVLLSSTQVYNIMAKIEDPHLKQLQMFLEVSQMVLAVLEEQRSPKCFQRVVFLVRDWFDVTKYQFGSEGGRKYLDSLFQAYYQQGELWTRQHNIQSFFEETECYLMPDPGVIAMTTKSQESSSDSPDDEHNQWDRVKKFCGQFEMLGRHFRHYLPKLAQFLIGPGQPLVRKIRGRPIQGKTLHEYFKKYISTLNSGLIPKGARPHELTLDYFNEYLAKDLMENHKDMVFEKMKRLQPYRNPKKIECQLAAAEEETRRHFKRIARGGSHERTPHLNAIENVFSSSKKGLYEAFNSRILIDVLLLHRQKGEELFLDPDVLVRHPEEVKDDIERICEETIKKFKSQVVGGPEDQESPIIRIKEELQFWKKHIENQRQMKIHAILETFNQQENQFALYLRTAEKFVSLTNLQRLSKISVEIDNLLKKENISTGAMVGGLSVTAGAGAVGASAIAGAATFASAGGLLPVVALVGGVVYGAGFFTYAKADQTFKTLKREAYQLVKELRTESEETEKTFDRISDLINSKSRGFSTNKILNIVLSASRDKKSLNEFIPRAFSYFIDPTLPPPLYIDRLAEVPPQEMSSLCTKINCDWDKFLNILDSEEQYFNGDLLREIMKECTDIAEIWKQVISSMTRIPNETPLERRYWEIRSMLAHENPNVGYN